MTPYNIKAYTSMYSSRAKLKLLSISVCVLCAWVLAFSVQAQESTSSTVKANVPNYEVLAEALSNDQVRDQLVEQLRQLALTAEANDDAVVIDETEQVVVEAATPSEVSAFSSGQIVSTLQGVAQKLRTDVIQSWAVLKALAQGDKAPVNRLKHWYSALINLALIIIITIFAFAILRKAVRPVFKRFDVWASKLPSKSKLAAQQAELERQAQQQAQLRAESEAELDEPAATEGAMGEFAHLQTEQPTEPTTTTATASSDPTHIDPNQAEKNYIMRYAKLRKLAAVVGAFVVDVVAIVGAAFIAYMVALLLPGHAQNATVLGLQFLTAFTAIEFVKALSRGVFATHYAQLRLLPINDSSAIFWNRWLTIVVTVGGYGLLVAVPVLQVVLSSALASVMGAVLIVIVYLYAIRVLWHKRHSVSHALLEYAEHNQSAVLGTLLRILARVWVWLALAYFTVLFVLTQVDQQNALSFMAKASLQSLGILVIGGVVFLLLSSLASHSIHLGQRWNRLFPLLEERLNAYVPLFLRFLRLLIVAAILLGLFDVWHVFDLHAWLYTGQGLAILNTLVRVVVVLLIAAFGWTLLTSMIEHRLSISGEKMPTEREKTLLMLFRNALTIVIVTMTILIVLSQVGIDIGPLIAGAGVVGLAIGFGAQKLVQDVITGVFIQLENGMNQNDVVEVAGLFGVVEKLTVRSVVIRTLDGGYHLVPFSAISSVSNHTRDYGYHYGEYAIGMRESVDEAIKHLELAFASTKKDPDVADAILEDISIPGVTSISAQGFSIRVLIKTTPGMQWAVQRSFNRFVKMHFDAAGIELPYPQTVVHFGRDKNGYAAPVDLRMLDAMAQAQKGEDLTAPPGQTPRPLPANIA